MEDEYPTPEWIEDQELLEEEIKEEELFDLQDDWENDDPWQMCEICGEEMEHVSCESCFGEGGWHDCGEDCCCCGDPWLNRQCPDCNGVGAYWECCALPHSDEQMKAHQDGVNSEVVGETS